MLVRNLGQILIWTFSHMACTPHSYQYHSFFLSLQTGSVTAAQLSHYLCAEGETNNSAPSGNVKLNTWAQFPLNWLKKIFECIQCILPKWAQTSFPVISQFLHSLKSKYLFRAQSIHRDVCIISCCWNLFHLWVLLEMGGTPPPAPIFLTRLHHHSRGGASAFKTPKL